MSKKTLNQANLEALGAEQLAALLMEVSAGSADIKRRLRLELSHNVGATELAHDVRKRLASLRKSTSFVGWRKRKALIKDLSTQVAMITNKIAPEEPTLAFDLLWQFIEMAPSVYGRVDDSRGDVGDVFRAALKQFEHIAPRAVLDPDALAERVWNALLDNRQGEWDGIVPLLASTLGTGGLERLKTHVQAYAEAPLKAEAEDHEALQFLRQLRGGQNYAAERKARFVKGCLQEIAAVSGDTQAYIAQYSDADLAMKDISAEVAMLLLEDGRATDALDILQNADPDADPRAQDAWDVAYITCLTDLGEFEDAQAHRWACFTETLNLNHLRDHLKEFPDFEDVEVEEEARKHVLTFPRFSTALHFCLHWPDLLSAATLITTRSDEINGDHSLLLAPAAEALRLRHPLAAVLLWRAMIDFTLGQGVSPRYGIAASYVADCAACDNGITDYAPFVTHDEYMQSLRDRHERKASFWTKVR